jgi:hypothetical protein
MSSGSTPSWLFFSLVNSMLSLNLSISSFKPLQPIPTFRAAISSPFTTSTILLSA